MCTERERERERENLSFKRFVRVIIFGARIPMGRKKVNIGQDYIPIIDGD